MNDELQAKSQKLRAKSRVAFMNELPNRTVSLGQSPFIRQKHNTKMLRPRLLPKSRTMHHHHMLLPNQFLHENFITLRNINARESIERATRRNATHPRNRLAPLLRKVAPRPQLAPHFHQMILRPLE